MTQEIIVYFILAGAIIFVLYSFVKKLRAKGNPCNGCSGCTLKDDKCH